MGEASEQGVYVKLEAVFKPAPIISFEVDLMVVYENKSLHKLPESTVLC